MEFNTSNSLKSDLFAAIFAPLAISPAISIIDKAIFTNASGKETLFKGIYNGIKSLGNPISFIKQPSFIWYSSLIIGSTVFTVAPIWLLTFLKLQ